MLFQATGNSGLYPRLEKYAIYAQADLGDQIRHMCKRSF